MRSISCTLSLGDRRLVARVATQSPQQERQVNYDGDISLLADRLPQLANADLRMLCLGAAQSTGAKLEIYEEGEYDYFAE